MGRVSKWNRPAGNKSQLLMGLETILMRLIGCIGPFGGNSFYYWRSYLSQVNDNQGSSPPSVPPHNLQHNGPAGEQPLMEPGRGPQIRVEFRVFNGFETYIASIWCRIIAEVIDTALVCALLKWYIPELDFR